MSYRSDLVELFIEIEVETEKAYGFREDRFSELVFLPKSQCELIEKDARGLATITCPEWLANKLGLI